MQGFRTPEEAAAAAARSKASATAYKDARKLLQGDSLDDEDELKRSAERTDAERKFAKEDRIENKVEPRLDLTKLDVDAKNRHAYAIEVPDFDQAAAVLAQWKYAFEPVLGLVPEFDPSFPEIRNPDNAAEREAQFANIFKAMLNQEYQAYKNLVEQPPGGTFRIVDVKYVASQEICFVVKQIETQAGGAFAENGFCAEFRLRKTADGKAEFSIEMNHTAAPGMAAVIDPQVKQVIVQGLHRFHRLITDPTDAAIRILLKEQAEIKMANGPTKSDEPIDDATDDTAAVEETGTVTVYMKIPFACSTADITRALVEPGHDTNLSKLAPIIGGEVSQKDPSKVIKHTGYGDLVYRRLHDDSKKVLFPQEAAKEAFVEDSSIVERPADYILVRRAKTERAGLMDMKSWSSLSDWANYFKGVRNDLLIRFGVHFLVKAEGDDGQNATALVALSATILDKIAITPGLQNTINAKIPAEVQGSLGSYLLAQAGMYAGHLRQQVAKDLGREPTPELVSAAEEAIPQPLKPILGMKPR